MKKTNTKNKYFIGVYNNLSNVIKEQKINKSKHIVLRVLAAVIFGLVTLFLAYTFCSIFNDQDVKLSFAVWFIVIYMIVGGSGYLLSVIISAIGIILTVFKKEQKVNPGQIAYFIVFTAVPICIWVLGLFILPLFFK